MKKFLVVLLALAMVFAIATTAMAADKAIPDYNDTTTSTEYANDIYRLTALGVLCGDSGWGNAYRPNDYLTRAEFAKIACYMFGKQDYKEFYKAQKSAFSDVPEGHWAEGFINCCNDNGLMVGVGGGKFAPNANVTKQEVASVVLRAVGYNGEGLPGSWPNNYIAKSQKVRAQWATESLFDYVEKIDGTAATRAEMAAIVNYALDLYKVSYVGNQTVIYGIGDVDTDGFVYDTLKTNEADLYDYFLGVDVDLKGKVTYSLKDGLDGEITLDVDPKVTTKATLLWNVFHALEVPYYFERWTGSVLENSFYADGPYIVNIDQALKATNEIGPRYMKFVEASGWGYEDVDADELLFKDALLGLQLPVASDYYIYDDSLDGELWNVGGRFASLTVTVDPTKTKITKLANGNLSGVEAVYAEMLSDVKYVDAEKKLDFLTKKGVKVDNGDVFSLDVDGFIGANLNGNYDFYDYDWFQENRVGIVKKVAKDKVTVDDTYFGEDGGIFCTLDGCKSHDKEYVFLKDGKLFKDASFMQVDDVVYFAGYLADGDIELYIVYTPKSATFDQLVNGTTKLNVSGTDYWYCDNDNAHAVSYDGGYADGGSYKSLIKAELKDYLGESCLFAAGYGKKYVATLIFAAGETNRKYGVIDGFNAKHVYPDPDEYYTDKLDFFGPEGLVTEDLDDDYWLGSTNTWLPGEVVKGYLTNYYLNDDDEVDYYAMGKVNGDDVGYVKLAPHHFGHRVYTNEKGLFKNADELVSRVGSTSPSPAQYKSFEGMKITADTIIFEVTTKDDGRTYKKTTLGKAENYINAEFTVQQMDIFEWDGNNITVLYVVNPHFNGDVLLGLFDTSRTDADGGFIQYSADGTEVRFSADQADGIPDDSLFYAAYKVQDDEVSRVHVWDAPQFPYNGELRAGDLAMLYRNYGPLMDPAKVRRVILNYVDGADDHYFATFEDIDPDLFDENCEFIDLTGDGDFDADFFGVTSHSTDEYWYAVTETEFGEIIQVFRFEYAPTGSSSDTTVIPWIGGGSYSIPTDHAWWLP